MLGNSHSPKHSKRQFSQNARALSCLVLCGCGGAQAKDPQLTTAAQATTAAPVVQPKAFIDFEVRAKDQKAALAEATRTAWGKVISPEWTAFFVGAELALPKTAFVWEPATRTARIRIDEAAVASMLDDFEELTPATQAPEQWQELINQVVVQEMANLACQRRQQLLGVNCIAPDNGPIISQLEQLSQAVVLQPTFIEGVPVLGRPVSPAHFRVVESTDVGLVPISDVPLLIDVEAIQKTPRARFTRVSGANGEVEYSFEGIEQFDPMPNARIEVNARAMLGPAAKHWKSQAAPVRVRPLSKGRTLLSTLESSRGKPSSTRVLAAAVQSELGRATEQELNPLGADWHMPTAEPPTPEQSRALALRLGGRYDYLVSVEATSAFASHMGTGRAWFEARASVSVIQLWSGQVVHRFDEAHTASGFGDDRADEEARRGLGEAIGQRLSREWMSEAAPLQSEAKSDSVQLGALPWSPTSR